MKRCPWCGTNELYIKYHDEEWGVPVHDDKKTDELMKNEGIVRNYRKIEASINNAKRLPILFFLLLPQFRFLSRDNHLKITIFHKHACLFHMSILFFQQIYYSLLVHTEPF